MCSRDRGDLAVAFAVDRELYDTLAEAGATVGETSGSAHWI